MGACTNCREAKTKCSMREINTNRPCERCLSKGKSCVKTTGHVGNQHRNPTRNMTSHTAFTQSDSAPRRTYRQNLAEAMVMSKNEIVKIVLGWDGGTENFKVAYHVIRRGQQPPRALSTHKILSENTQYVHWQNQQVTCPMQIASRRLNNRRVPMYYWGFEVDKALADGDISEDDVLRHFKPYLYGDSSATHFNDRELCERVRKLLNETVPDRSTTTEGTGNHERDLGPGSGAADYEQIQQLIRQLWIRFQREALLYTYNHIWDGHKTDLRWLPPSSRSGKYTDLKDMDFKGCEVEVGLTLPAGLSVSTVKRALDCAAEAGLPNCCPISEPCADAACILQSVHENTSKKLDPRATMYANLGGSTFDACIVVASSIENTNDPRSRYLILKEVVQGQTVWCGAATINDEFWKVLQQELPSEKVAQSDGKDHINTKLVLDKFRGNIVAAFEASKQQFQFSGFDGQASTKILVPCLQNLDFKSTSGRLRICGGRIILDSSLMYRIYQPCLTGVLGCIYDQLDKFEAMTHNHMPDLGLEAIVLTGGGFRSEYLFRTIVNEFSSGDGRCRVDVQRADPAESSLVTARGAIVLSVDKEFIGERTLRTAYGLSWDRQIGKEFYKEERVFRSHIDGCRWLTDCINWLFRVGEKVGSRHVASMQGFRTLYEGSSQQTATGWMIYEHVWCTNNYETSRRDDCWTEDKSLGIENAGTVSFEILKTDLEDIPVQYDNTGVSYREIDYMVELVIEHMKISWSIILPRSGTFKQTNGQPLICREGSLIDARGCFELFEPAARI